MARRTHTYAIRLAVEGGGQVKAELVSVGQSGEQSLKRIETAGERASGGLKGLGRQAELLRTGIRTLGGALDGRGHGRRPHRPGRSLDLGGQCHRQDRRHDRGRGRGAAGAALRREGVRGRAADARHGSSAVHPANVDTLGEMLRAGAIDQAMHDAGQDLQAAFIIAQLAIKSARAHRHEPTLPRDGH